jgi:hypothetical protein
MARVLEKRGELTLFAMDELADIDFREVAHLMDRTWRVDYAGKVRYVYDERYLQWLIAGSDWIGTGIRNERGELIAILFGLLRTLCIQGRSYQGVYAVCFTVAPEYRDKHVGRWMQTIHRHRSLNERGCTLGLALMQVGHAGLPSVTRAIAVDDGGFTSTVLHRDFIWSARLDARRSLQCAPGVTANRVHWNGKSFDLHLPGAPHPSEVAEKLREPNASIFFEPNQSYLQHYYNARSPIGGAVLVRDGNGASAQFTYSQINVAIDDDELGTIGQLQTISIDNSPTLDERDVMRTACTFLQATGCMSVSHVPQGNLGVNTLPEAGFVPSRDEVVFWLRTPSDRATLFQSIAAPVCVDAL